MVSLLSPSPASVSRAMDSIKVVGQKSSVATTAKSGSISNVIPFP